MQIGKNKIVEYTYNIYFYDIENVALKYKGYHYNLKEVLIN